ncbi:tripartite tricarboxylate transporter substrate binding protein [Variovorax rhizosphaerae]|uniref:Tripartite tricarboxylate transporter substrate binding protein n=1 Tax=Variovorax rhizosphaerae TaxID=1836200 RepID=A0ABU8WUG4_9BURK
MTNRRQVLSLSLLALAGVASAEAQTPPYPSRPITIVAPFPAGGGADVVARIISDRLRESLGQPVIIDNRVGAAGSIGTTMVARAPADGYTLLIASQSHTANPSLYAKLPWDPIKSFAPIVLVGVIPNVVAVSASSPYKTLADFVAYAKTKQGQVNYGSAGIGTSIHLTAEMLKQAAQINLTHIPYKSDSESYAALRAGDIAMAPLGLAFAKAHIDSGELRALAVTTPKRSRLLPNVPTAAESGFPAFDVRPWYAFLAPTGTPPAVVAKLNAAITEAMKTPAVQAKLLDLGLDLDPGTPEALTQFLQADASRWDKVIKQAGIRLE